jgi:NAD+-dependent protein deacetylase sirtuin 5
VLAASITETDSSPSSTQPALIEMHGRLFDLKCSSHSCGYVEPNFSSPVCEALRDTESMVEKGVMDPEIPAAALPRCAKCNAIARPGVVWFGEEIPGLKKMYALVDKADLCLVVGTSSKVSS